MQLRKEFLARFGGVFEHSAWVAESAWDDRGAAQCRTAEELHAVMTAAMRAAPREKQLALINAHPDLAGRLAMAGRLTADSTKEQKSAGLAFLTDDEKARFTALNDAYKGRFGFPFIMAVKNRTKGEILVAFEARLKHDSEQEFATALNEIEKIVMFRLRDLLPG